MGFDMTTCTGSKSLNRLTLPALAAVAGWRLFEGEWQFLFVWAVCFYFWLRGWYGGGDAKVLMVVTGVWTGWPYLLWLSAGLAFIYGIWAFLLTGACHPLGQHRHRRPGISQ